MVRIVALTALLLALLAPSASTASAAADPAAAAQSAAAWLAARQQPDGSFPGFGTGSTADAVFALAAAGIDPNGVLKNGSSPVSYLGNVAQAYAGSSVSAAGKLTLAVTAAGKDPRAFGGLDLVESIQGRYDARSGVYGANPSDHAFALLALASAGVAPPPAALAAAARVQRPDGGWSFDGKAGSDTNTTALMVQALVASGSRSGAVAKALGYLRGQQNADGGFPYDKASQYGGDSDANSTALVLQAFAAAGADRAALPHGDPLPALLAFQNQSGAFRYQAAMPDDNDLATAQAVPALLLKPFPLARQAGAPAPAQAAPQAPAALPRTGGDSGLPWAALAAALALGVGAALRRRV